MECETTMTPAELERWRDELDWMENQEQRDAMTDAELDGIETEIGTRGMLGVMDRTDALWLIAELRQTRQRLAEAEANDRESERFCKEMLCRCTDGLHALHELAAVKKQVESLGKFKAYVHQRLDEAGIPVDPDSPHKAAGCRIGGRLDIVLSSVRRLAEAEAERERLRGMADEQPKCELCGEPMPPGERMFRYHGYSGPCPKPPLPKTRPAWIDAAAKECSDRVLVGAGEKTFAEIIERHALRRKDSK